MDLLILVVTLTIVGFLTWLLTEKVPMDPMMRTAIRVIVLLVMVLYALRIIGFNIPNLM